MRGTGRLIPTGGGRSKRWLKSRPPSSVDKRSLVSLGPRREAVPPTTGLLAPRPARSSPETPKRKRRAYLEP